MNKFILAALVAAQTASATVWTAVDDPRCHDDPGRPVLEPTPGPTPYPPPPGQMREYEPPATTAPPPEVPCTGEVTGFQVYDLVTQETTDLVDGQMVPLADMPGSFTIKAVTSSDTLSSVDLYLDDTLLQSDTTAPYTFGDSNFLELNTEGTYTLKGVGPTDTPGLTCSITITITYGNPHNCEGIIQQFALYDTDAQDIVPGYDLLESGEVLRKADLPPNLSIVAIDNGRGNGVVKFGFDNNFDYHSASDAPYAISGLNGDGTVKKWDIFDQKEYIRIRASSSDALGTPETRMCEIELQIEQDWSCPYRISGFSLLYAGTKTPVPGYENILGYRAIDLNTINAPNGLALEAHSSHGGVHFFVDGDYIKTENWAPYSANGDNSAGLHEFALLRNTGQFVIEAKHKDESNSKRCQLVLTIQRDYTINTIDNTEYCAPEAVVPEQVGNVMFAQTPVVVTERVTNESVTFKTVQSIASQTMGWVTTTFVTESGYEVCDMIENMAPGAESEHVYTAKCFNGFAFAEVYAQSDAFDASEATADTALLAPGCKTSNTAKVVKYTFVFSCDCANMPDVPDEFIGGPNKSEQQCTGATAQSWGDPHLIPYNGARSNGWNCQGEGEFVLSKATLDDYAFDFELRARFTRFGQNIPWSFNSGMVADHGVKVQISMGVIGETAVKPNYMGTTDLPIYFYVDDVPRYFHEGAGDWRIQVRVEGYHVYVTFVETGIQVHVQVRPFSVDHHSGIMNNRDATIPGSFSTSVCLPSDNDKINNVMGLLGTPTPSFDDNFMDKNGVQMAKPSNLNHYCETEWCITNAGDSLFSFESGYDFAYYNKCGARRDLSELRELEETVPQEYIDACEAVGGHAFCIEECQANGLEGCKNAVYEMLTGEQAIRDSQAGAQPDDARCCSIDHKTCMDGCDVKNPHFCDVCDPDAVFLPKGTYETTQGRFKDCKAKGAAVAAGEECCPGLDGSTGTCVKKSERRLEEFKMVRPDLPEVRNIVPLHTEL